MNDVTMSLASHWVVSKTTGPAVADDMTDGVAAQSPPRVTEGSRPVASEATDPAVADDTTALPPRSFRDSPRAFAPSHQGVRLSRRRSR